MRPATHASAPRQTAAATTVAAGTIHLAAAVPHLADSVVLGIGFVLVGVTQILAAIATLVLGSPGRRWPITALAAVNLGAIVAWGLSRTVGLPVGHPGPEPFAFADLVTVLLEVSALGATVWWLGFGGRRRPTGRLAASVAIVWLVSVAGAGAAVAGLGLSPHEHGAASGSTEHSDADEAHDGHDDGHDDGGEQRAEPRLPHDDGTVPPPADDTGGDQRDEPSPEPDGADDGHTHAPGEGH